MAIYVGDISAYLFWFGEHATLLRVGSYPAVHDLSDASALAHDVPMAELERWGILTRPVHVDVPDHASLRRSARVMAHVWSGPYPDRSFVCLARDIYIESPLAALVHHAPRLSRWELLVRCHQLCGSYGVVGGQLRQCEPMATKDELEEFVAEAVGMRGSRQLRRVVGRVAEGAASPVEAALAVLLRARVCDGGCGLPPFTLNHRIEPVDDGRPVRYADVFWELARLILEYDSDLFHTGARKIGEDAARRVQLAAQGYEVVTLTNWQLKQDDEFLAVANLLRRRLGLDGLPTQDAEFLRRHRELKRLLLDGAEA